MDSYEAGLSKTAGRFLALIACVMCSLPFFIISRYEKDSMTPITFWAGDKSLKDKVIDIKGYNQRMAKLYGKCGAVFILTGIVFLVFPAVGTILIAFECTIGIYIVYRCYKRILEETSVRMK